MLKSGMSGSVTKQKNNNKQCRIFLNCEKQMFILNLIFILLRYPLEDIPKRIYILKLLFQEKVLSNNYNQTQDFNKTTGDDKFSA